MHNEQDFIYISFPKSKRYRLYCDSCKKDRGYGMKSRSSMLCKICTHKGKNYFDHSDIVFRENMSKAKLGCKVWNSGTSKYTKEQRQIRTNLSSAIRIRLNDRNSSKKGESYLKKLGYSIEELKRHLESKFQPGMTWNNYGKDGWEIDHVIPDSWFNYSSMDDISFKTAWSLNNLQPLWKSVNRSKGNRFVG